LEVLVFRRRNPKASTAHAGIFSLEGLEERRLLSAGHHGDSHRAQHVPAAHSVRHVRHDLKRDLSTNVASGHAKAKARKHGKALAKGHSKAKKNDDNQATGTGGTGTAIPVVSTQTILFATAPSLVQTGLQAQAPAGVRIDPNKALSVQTFQDGTVIYATDLTTNGQTTHVSVDANGNPSTGPVANPTPTTTGHTDDDNHNDDDDPADAAKHDE
jgi:hypothetical protein